MLAFTTFGWSCNRLVRYLLLTVLLGCCFLGVKGLEYHEDIQEHLVPGRHFTHELPIQASIFWFLYWAMTGLHALHVTVGVGLLAVMAWLDTARLAVVKLAVVLPPLVLSVPWPRFVTPSVKMTAPLGLPEPVTVAVNVTL